MRRTASTEVVSDEDFNIEIHLEELNRFDLVRGDGQLSFMPQNKDQ